MNAKVQFSDACCFGCRACAISIAGALAQTPEFEVVTVRPARLPSASGTIRPGRSGGPDTADPGRITWTYVTLRSLILQAFNIGSFQLPAPEWLGGARFDVVAKVPVGATKEQIPAMIRGMLEDRFHLVVARTDKKEIPVYLLFVAKSGLKLRELKGGEPVPDLGPVRLQIGADGFPIVPPGISDTFISNGRVRIVSSFASMEKFAGQLTAHLGRPVVDKTGLTGIYDLVLTFAPENIGGLAPPPPPPGPGTLIAPALEPLPRVFQAIQEQLGLRLEAATATFEIITVETIDRDPSAN